MGVTAALALGSAAISAFGSIQEGRAQRDQAEINARIYEKQAQNIAEARKITDSQYRTKANVLRGQATAAAARGGIKISGSTANSISQSIMQLQMDNSYEQYNLASKQQQAYANAALERYQGRMAYNSGLLKAGTTALTAGKDYYSKYWENSGAQTWLKGQKNKFNTRGTKISGGWGTSAKDVMNPISIV